MRGYIKNSGDSADIQTPWLEAVPVAVEPASVPKPLFWLSLPLGRLIRSLKLFRAPPSPPDGGSDQRASRRGRARGALSRQSGHRGSSLSVGAAKKYRHTGQCRFTMPGRGGSQGPALLVRASASCRLVWAAVPRRFFFMSAFPPSGLSLLPQLMAALSAMICLSRLATASRSISAADLRSPRLFALPRRLPDLGRLSTGQVGPSSQGRVGGLWTTLPTRGAQILYSPRLSNSACLSRSRYSGSVSGRTPSLLVVVGMSRR